MNTTTSTHDTERHGPSRYWGGLAVFLIAAAFFLWTEHRAHLLGVLPYLIFLLCPLSHFFMHRGHGGHGGHHES
jgi:hypothetical protein